MYTGGNGDDSYHPRFSNGSMCLFLPVVSCIDAAQPRRSLSYDKLPPEPLTLTVLKLDGSSFGIKLAKTGTVGQLKLAVEAAFDHLPKKGPSKVSWAHVWGQFCLCHGGQKLLIDGDYISMYGIKDGDHVGFTERATNITAPQLSYWIKFCEHVVYSSSCTINVLHRDGILRHDFILL